MKSIFYKIFTQINPINKHPNFGRRFAGHSVWYAACLQFES